MEFNFNKLTPEQSVFGECCDCHVHCAGTCQIIAIETEIEMLDRGETWFLHPWMVDDPDKFRKECETELERLRTLRDKLYAYWDR